MHNFLVDAWQFGREDDLIIHLDHIRAGQADNSDPGRKRYQTATRSAAEFVMCL